ncbi:MAG TPA: signal recognition particle-docking protein FtsY [Acidimicrobiia bacterium]|nr:signal recognition particle-docking protein FtsY [Acidimicrobiia bacterium]
MDATTIVVVIAATVIIAVVVVALVLRGRAKPISSSSEVTASRSGRAASSLGASLRQVLGSGGVSEHTWAELEDAMLAADVGVEASSAIVRGVRSARPENAEVAREQLARQLRLELGDKQREFRLEGSPSVILVVGVNGTGKTTTIAKLAARFGGEGKKVVLAAADTFRAAAGAQLQTWGDRLGVDVVGGQDGGDPASVAFDAISSARAKGADVVIVDTAGRLHGKKNLMAEMTKIHRVAAGTRGEVDEVLLVLDATAGQNGITQVREFSDAVPVSGIVLTKLDGTAKGGIVIAIERQLGVPVKLVGVGEGIDDLLPFDPDRFVDELLED